MIGRAIFAIVLVGTLLLLPDAVAGQGNVRIDISTPTIAFRGPDVGDFDAGWIDHPGVTVSVTSRPGQLPWELRIRAPGGTLGNGKPVSDLHWRVAGTNGWSPLSTADAAVFQSTGDQDVTVEFRLMLGWESDGPGAYFTDIDFTALRL